MANIISRLKLESGEFDSKIKRASQELLAYSEHCKKMGLEMGYANRDAKEFAKALGSMQTVSQTARGKINELSEAFINAKVMYKNMTDEEKKGEFGRNLSASLDQLKTRLNAAKQDLADVNKELAGSSGGGLGNLIGGISGKLGISPQMFTGIGAGIAAFGALNKAIGDNISTARGFEKSMSQLSSLTGMVGSDLDKLKEYAIDLGSTSTLTASQVADAFRLIGSQQPQLLSSGEALKEVTKYAITLSEAAGIDLQTAAQTLSTSINQMGGDSNNAARYVNVLAAASQKGAGDIAWLGEAITKSATAAKAVGTDYEELVANLEQLAKAGFDASTAGTALRSIIMNLEKQANNEFKPSVVGLTQAFENLGKANLDIVGYQEIAGKMFASQAMALANASQEAKKMTEAITGTNIAEAQAKTNTDNLDGALKSLASAWEGLNLHINSSNGLLKAFVDWCTNVIRDLDNMTTSAGRAKKALQELNGGGNGQPSKVDRQINGLRGSNFKQQKYNSTLGQYNHDIKVAEYYKKKYKEAGWTGGSVLSDITRRFGVNMRGEEDIDNLINNLKTLREDYIRRAEKILNSTAEADNGKGKGGVVLDVDADTEEATKSIKELQAEIKKLKKLRDDAADEGNFEMRDKYNADIKSVQAQIKAMRGTTTTSRTTDKEAEQTAKMLAELRRAEAKATKEIADARAREHQTETRGLSGFNEQTIAAWTSMMKDQLGKADFGSVVYQSIEENMRDMTTIVDLTKEALKHGLDPQSLGLEELYEQAFDNIDISDEALSNIVKKINAAIKNGTKLEINEETGKVDEKKEEKDKRDTLESSKKMVGGLSQVASGLQQMGVELPKEVQNLIGVLQGAMSVMEGVNTIITATQTPALTANTLALGALTAAVNLNTATGLLPGFFNGGTVRAAEGFSGIVRAAEGFSGIVRAAEGFSGIVPGTQFSGDNIPILANAGEVVLNKAQTAALASDIQSGGSRSVNVRGVLRGTDILLVADRTGQAEGRGELLFFKG